MATKAKKRGYLVTVPADMSKPISRVEFKGKSPAYELLRDAVGGLIQPIKAKYEGKARNCYVNEEGLLHGLPFNSRFTRMAREFYGPNCQAFVGNAVIIFWETVAPQTMLPIFKGGGPCGLKLSQWLTRRTESHTIHNHEALASAFTVDFGVPPTWPTHSTAEAARDIKGRGKGGEVTMSDEFRAAYGYEIAEHYARTLAAFSPWQNGLGFRWRSALDALEKAGY